jgi:hypothetical protein
LAHRVVVERSLYRVIGMGEVGDLLTVHRRSVPVSEATRTCFSSEQRAERRPGYVERFWFCGIVSGEQTLNTAPAW